MAAKKNPPATNPSPAPVSNAVVVPKEVPYTEERLLDYLKRDEGEQTELPDNGGADPDRIPLTPPGE